MCTYINKYINLYLGGKLKIITLGLNNNDFNFIFVQIQQLAEVLPYYLNKNIENINSRRFLPTEKALKKK